MNSVRRFARYTTNLFAVWVVLFSVWAWFSPPSFAWVKPYIAPGLGIIMLGMGLTLTLDDLKRVVRLPGMVLLGTGSQFLIMPFLAWTVSQLFGLNNEVAVGLILVGCCPGGTASNVVSYLARANVPLSIAMTMVSTLFAVVLTPLLAELLASERTAVDAIGMLKSMLLIVLLPVVSGVFINHFVLKENPFGQFVKTISPIVSVFMVALIVAFMSGVIRGKTLENPVQSVLAVVVFHLLGFGLGWCVGHLFGIGKLAERTLSIEVGMQNSGLAIELAKSHFPMLALAQVSCTVSAITHCVVGSLLATVWGRDTIPEDRDASESVVG